MDGLIGGRRAEEWGGYLAAEREELKWRRAGLVGRLLGDPLPSESGRDLARFAEEDRQRAERGLVQLRRGARVWWKPLDELAPEDCVARSEARAVFESWLGDRRDCRPWRYGPAEPPG